MSLELTRSFLDGAAIGLFGAGHLGRTLAIALLEAGLPRHNLAICHRGSLETERELVTIGLSDLVAVQEDVTSRSKILLYLVRPQHYNAIEGLCLPKDGLFASFLAGISLARIPASIADTQRMRVMTSAPDTLRQRNGIAAVYPAIHPVIREILEAIGLRLVALRHESDIHAFTALGPCLPIALTYWEGIGNKTDDGKLLEMAERFSLPGYDRIVRWAHSVCPRGLSDDEQKRYLTQAVTPGGVSDAILAAIRTGAKLPAALERGIERSVELARM